MAALSSSQGGSKLCSINHHWKCILGSPDTTPARRDAAHKGFLSVRALEVKLKRLFQFEKDLISGTIKQAAKHALGAQQSLNMAE